MAVDTGDKVTRKYANFRGVDFRGEDCSINRSPDALNVWRNYKKLASIETRKGLEHFFTLEHTIQTMRWYGSRLYFVDYYGYIHYVDARGEVFGEEFTMPVGSPAILFTFNGKLYAMGRERFWNVSDNVPVKKYVPTTSIGRKPSGGGKIHEDVNMLTTERINTFLGDGKSNVLVLDSQDVLTGAPPIIHVDGKRIMDGYDGVTITMTKEGKITIKQNGEPYILPEPKTDGQDNISVLFEVENNYQNRYKIYYCTIVEEFDNRLFFSGNSTYPNMVWHSSLNDPGYVSDLDYYKDGTSEAPIRSLVAGNNALWVFCGEGTNSNVFYHVPTLDSEYGKVYPSSHSSIALGCAGRAINFNDDIVFFSSRGMESASTDINTEQFATHRSSLVDRKMIAHPKYKDMILAEWEGYLLVFMGNDVFLADSRAMLTNENHYEYEWYHWTLGKYNVTCATVHDGVLYVATDNGENGDQNGHVFTLTGDPAKGDEQNGQFNGAWGERNEIHSYWTTPKDKFGAANKLKTTNKKGCVIEAVGDVDVYAKVEDTDFELIGTNNDVDDYFVSRIKRKKFKDIQLKFQSQTGFCLESATLECFVGGYIKR